MDPRRSSTPRMKRMTQIRDSLQFRDLRPNTAQMHSAALSATDAKAADASGELQIVDPMALDSAAYMVKHFGYANSLDAFAEMARLSAAFAGANGQKDEADEHEFAFLILDQAADDLATDAGDLEDEEQ